MRKEYEMTQAQLDKILDACKPVPYIVVGGMPGLSAAILTMVDSSNPLRDEPSPGAIIVVKRFGLIGLIAAALWAALKRLLIKGDTP